MVLSACAWIGEWELSVCTQACVYVVVVVILAGLPSLLTLTPPLTGCM